MAAQKAKIFYRDRTKIGEGKKSPRFKLVAVSGIDMKLYAKHIRKQELEQIAESAGAELVMLSATQKGSTDEVEVAD